MRMSGKSMTFGKKKNQKGDFYKNKKAIKIDDNTILALKEVPYGSTVYLNILLYTMMMISSDHYS